jgi:REP element-mobilizing transposase RayT
MAAPSPSAMPTALRGHGSGRLVRFDVSLKQFWGNLRLFSSSPLGGKTMAMPHRKTCKRYNTPGHAHALTFSCFRRQAFLSKDGSRQWMIEAIDRARDKLHFHVWAYVIMPEHAHLLVWPTEKEYDISEILNAIKQSVAKTRSGFRRGQRCYFALYACAGSLSINSHNG